MTSLSTADSKSGEARVRPVRDVSCSSMSFLLPFIIERLHFVFLSVWAPHCQPSIWSSLLRAAGVRGGELVIGICGVDLVFVVDVTFTADVDVGCDDVRASLTGCEGRFVCRTTADTMRTATGLLGERDGLLGGVGSIEAIVAVMLILPQKI
jgi:hypothetical protein